MKAQKKTVYVIINPVSGTGSKRSIPDKIVKQLDPYKYNIHFFITGYIEHAQDIAAEAVEKKVDYVIAVGGDGTVNDIGKMLVNTDVIFGIIPCGSGNGLARDLGISLNVDRAIQTIKSGTVKKIDYGIANDHIFFCTCGMGFDALISEKALEQTNRGKLMYAQSVLSTLFTFKPKRYKIITPDGTFDDKAFIVTCANASQYGNDAFIAPNADIQDGKMNIEIVKPLTPIEMTQAAIQMFTKNLPTNSNLVEIITSEAIFERECEGAMHIDGNAIQTQKDIHVRIIKQGLNVIVPRK